MSTSETDWVAPYADRVLARWVERADAPNGVFHPYLDREWRHHRDGPRTLVTQCRLIYNFSAAFARDRNPAHADLARRGIAALERGWGLPGGGWRWACDGDGKPLDDTFDAYGHAFVVLALSTAAKAFADTDSRDAALATWAFTKRRFGDHRGGLVWHLAPDGRRLDPTVSQNPLMHAFEALLVLAPQDPSGEVRADAFRLLQFLRERMVGPGALPEWYDPDWTPIPAGDLAVIDLGHMFEWAWLLSEADRIAPGDGLLDEARAFLAYGMAHGYDAEQGGIFNQADYDGRVVAPLKGWWQQCEAVRAMHRHAVRHGASGIDEPLRQSLAFVREHFVDDEFGGWYENPPGMGGEVSLVKGNMHKLDYHILNVCWELIGD